VKALPWIVSALVHIGLLLSGLFALQKVEYGIEAGKNSVEVNLVAAAAAPAPAAPTPPLPQAPPVDEPDPDMAAAPPTPPTPEPTPPEPPKITPPTPPTPKVVQATPERGDSSSPNPGKDAVSAHSDSGAILTVKPDYLSNPAPDYPESCRRRKEEGLVVLDVIVGTGGRAESVSLHSSSGFADLDRSATTAVATWRFRPATLAGVKVKSRVEVPVRFRLDG
jgi:protein TonB